jgi:hypothetical protein
LCACFTDWQKAFECVNLKKLIQIIKGTRIDWRERKLQIAHRRDFYSATGPRGDKKCEDWKRS